jgi:hypothetical protein
VGHLAVLFVLLSARGSAPPMAVEPEPMAVSLVAPPLPPPEPAVAPTPAPPAPAKPPPPKAVTRRSRAPAPPDALPAGKVSPVNGDAELSEAQVASAATAGSGAGGRPCDMVRRLQAALRKDRRVQAAVADASSSGKAMLVWNGEWVRSNGQDGNGLAAVREAIMWEVGFAPEACRAEPVRGLVLLSLNDGPGAGRLVLGSGGWRWSDLLRAR